MLNAASALRGRGPWVTNGGWEYPVVLAAAGASIALIGPGSISADHALGLNWSTAWGVGGVTLGAAAAVATLLIRRQGVARAAHGDQRKQPLAHSA
jgi:putative oxidoreductase